MSNFSSTHISKICRLTTKNSIDDTSLIVEMIWFLKTCTTNSTMINRHRSNSKFINSKRDEQSNIVSTFHWLTRTIFFIRRQSKSSIIYAKNIVYVCQFFKNWNLCTISSKLIFDHYELSTIRKFERHIFLFVKFFSQIFFVIVYIEFCLKKIDIFFTITFNRYFLFIEIMII